MVEPSGVAFPNVDLFHAIANQAVQAAGIDVANRVVVKDLAHSGLPGQVMIIDRDGLSARVTKPDPQRVHKLNSCKDVVKFVKSGLFASPIVWIGEKKVIVTDDNSRLRGDYAVYELKTTEMFDTVVNLGEEDGYSQSEFLALLRVELARAFTSDDARFKLITKVRSIIKREQSVVGKGSGSFEVGVFDAQNKEVDWEDSFKLSTTVIEDPISKATYPVEVILDVRPEGNRTSFVLKPVAADVAKATQDAMDVIKDYITADVGDVHVFLGSPA